MHVAPELDWQEVQHWPTVAVIETDRFCDGCGYNLRTQWVRREPRTGVLVCRCPECSRFHAAADATSCSRPILRRALSLLLLMWVLLILGAFFTCVVLEFCVMEESFREFTMYVPGKVGFVFVTRPMPTAERNLVMVVFGAGSLGLGLASGLVSAVALHHWRRWAQALLMVLLAAAAAGSAGFSIWERVASRAPDLIGFGLTLVAIHALLQVFGGLIGVRFGRPFARLLVRMFIPPGWRGPLAFLWLVDGREPPLRPAAVEAAGRAPAGSIA